MLIFAFWWLDLHYIYFLQTYQPKALYAGITVFLAIVGIATVIGVLVSKTFAGYVGKVLKKIFSVFKLIPKLYWCIRDGLYRKGVIYEVASVISLIIVIIIV